MNRMDLSNLKVLEDAYNGLLCGVGRCENCPVQYACEAIFETMKYLKRKIVETNN